MQSGNAGIPGGGLSYYAGDPSNVDTKVFDAPLGSLILDINGGPPRSKTSAAGDNTGFSELRTIQFTANSPLTAASLTFNALGNDETLYLTPAGTIAALTITFPTDALSRIGQQIGFVSTQTVTALTLTLPGSVAITGTTPTSLVANALSIFTKVAANTWLASASQGGTVSGGTVVGEIDSDIKVLAGSITYTSNATPAVITGFTWNVVPGTYFFDLNLPTVMTTVGGLTLEFVLATAVLTSIQYQSYAATASDNTTGVSTTGSTATSATKVFDSKTAAYTYVRAWGTFVVGTGGTFSWFASQNTSASGGDVTTLSLGAYARLKRAL